MFKQRVFSLTVRRVVLFLLAIAIVACTKDEGVDYCRNHGAFHAAHLSSIATLVLEVSDTGDLKGSLSIPRSTFGGVAESDLTALFGDAEKSFTLQSEHPCVVAVTDISMSAAGLEARFAASCGADNKLGKINVLLFGHLKQLEEVVASVTTSATSKRFGISRQCDSPIFRID